MLAINANHETEWKCIYFLWKELLIANHSFQTSLTN